MICFKSRGYDYYCYLETLVSDAGILAEVEEWKKNLAQFSSEFVGKTLVYLNGTFEECRFRECNLGNLICDAMVSDTCRVFLIIINQSGLQIC